MKCANCEKEKAIISAAGKHFCSDVCHLRFWKEEMPNLGGQWIDEEDILMLDKLSGEPRKRAYDKLVMFILNNFENTSLMLRMKSGA